MNACGSVFTATFGSFKLKGGGGGMTFQHSILYLESGVTLVLSMSG